jgi:ATP-dependent DNA ligase
MRARGGAAARPEWVAPQLTQLVDAAPGGDEWLHEIEYEGYRMHARLDRGAIKLLTRTGLDWTNRRPRKPWQQRSMCSIRLLLSPRRSPRP